MHPARALGRAGDELQVAPKMPEAWRAAVRAQVHFAVFAGYPGNLVVGKGLPLSAHCFQSCACVY